MAMRPTTWIATEADSASEMRRMRNPRAGRHGVVSRSGGPAADGDGQDHVDEGAKLIRRRGFAHDEIPDVFEFLFAAIEPQVALILIEVGLDSFDLHISSPAPTSSPTLRLRGRRRPSPA